jgi:hypothetical protein
MDSKGTPMKILYNTMGVKRPAGKPKRRRTEAAEEDPKKIAGIRNWKREAMDTQRWRSYIQETKVRYRSVAPYKKMEEEAAD